MPFLRLKTINCGSFNLLDWHFNVRQLCQAPFWLYKTSKYKNDKIHILYENSSIEEIPVKSTEIVDNYAEKRLNFV